MRSDEMRYRRVKEFESAGRERLQDEIKSKAICVTHEYVFSFFYRFVLKYLIEMLFVFTFFVFVNILYMFYDLHYKEWKCCEECHSGHLVKVMIISLSYHDYQRLTNQFEPLNIILSRRMW